jgi:hypothetical protein
MVWRHSFGPAWAAFAPLEESKVVSSHPRMVNRRQVLRAIIFASLLSVLSAASVSLAYGQFTLTASAVHPAAGVDPGGVATATVNLGPATGFTNAVALSCAVVTQVASGTPPLCAVSPVAATPPSTPALTITTFSGTPAGTYQIAVTGTYGGATQTATLYLSVADLTEDYTLSVLPTTAIPSPIPAGSSATTTVSVLPIGDYTGSVTLACLAVTPVVTAAPYCSFTPATVTVGGGPAPTSQLTIFSFGASSPTGKLSYPRIFYAMWLAVPGLALVGAGVGKNHRRKLLGIFFLMAVAGGLLLLPACNTNTLGTTAANGGITPKNTYTFTLSAVDVNGAGPSNTTTCTTSTSGSCDSATVTIEVTTSTTTD